MNTSAFTNGLRRLFRFSAVFSVALAVIALSGCGHHCHCNKCHTNTCNTCSTCGVSDNSSAGQPICTSCQTCQTGTCSTCNTSTSSYDRVGAAPASLSEPMIQQAPTTSYAAQPAYAPPPAPSYSTSSNFSGTSTSMQRPGESQELPLFSKSVAQPTFASEQPNRGFQQAQQPAAVILKDTPAPAGSGQYHTLEKGETVYALSRKFGVKAKVILEANHFNDPNHLAVGTKVFIPAN